MHVRSRMITEEDLEGFGSRSTGGRSSYVDDVRAALGDSRGPRGSRAHDDLGGASKSSDLTGEEAFRRRAAMSGRDADRELSYRERGAGGGGPAGGSMSGAPRERRSYDDEPSPPLHSIHKGTVKQIKPFGALVKMDGYRKFGLVHVSQYVSLAGSPHFTM